MKKIVAVAVAVLALSGCGSSGYTLGDEPPSAEDRWNESLEIEQELQQENDLRGAESEPVAIRCVYAPTYNDNWHDDMLCGDERPYLLPGDDYITRDEIEAAARKWESSDEGYREYVRDYAEYLEREREFDEAYLSQFDEYGNCLNPNGCHMERP